MISNELYRANRVGRLSNTSGTGARWPEHIVDVKLALRFLKEHIADYGGDPDCIVIAGGRIEHLCHRRCIT